MEKVQYHFKVTFTCLIVLLITQNALGSQTEPPIVINTRPVPNEITAPAHQEVPIIDGSIHNDKDNSLSKCSEPMTLEGMAYEPVKESYMPNDTIRYSCRSADTENVFVVYKCLPDKSWIQIDDYGREIQSTDDVIIPQIPQCINSYQCPLLRKFHNDTGVIHNTDALLKAKCSYTIIVNKGSRILLTFKNSNTGISVLIYDGVNNLGNLIGQWRGTTEAPYDTIESFNRTVFVEVDTTNTSRTSPFTIEFAAVTTQSQNVECPEPEKPNFGFIIGNNFNIGESVEFDCEPFFLLTTSTSSSRTITCVDDGGVPKWSNNSPQCIGMCPGELDPIQTMDNGTIASANYPDDYGPNQECTWAVKGKTTERFTLTFKTLLTNQDDLLNLIDGSGGSGNKRRLLQIGCTKQNCSGTEFKTQTNTFEIQFISGSSPITGSKFLIEFKPFNESESESTSSPTSSLASTSVSSTSEITSAPSTKVSTSMTPPSTTPPSTTPPSTTPPSTTPPSTTPPSTTPPSTTPPITTPPSMTPPSTTPPSTTLPSSTPPSTTPPSTTPPSTTPPSTTPPSTTPPSTTPPSTTPPSTTVSTTPPSTTATRGTTPLFGSSTVTFQVITYSTNMPITEENKGPPTNTGIIVAAIVIPILTICIAILLVYLLWYRKRHPVRLGLGRRETQVENPMYNRPRRTSTATLMLDPNEVHKINGQLQLGIINNGLDPENPDNSPTFNRKTPLA